MIFWKGILKIDANGTHANYVRTEGNSFNDIAITSRLRYILELDMSITDVFNYSTISSYSNKIEQTITALLDE